MENIVGHDHRMLRIYDMIDSVADTRATVLITGESGTGKSLIARAIHRRSARRDKPFVEVACGALPETLLESELFGHVPGPSPAGRRQARQVHAGRHGHDLPRRNSTASPGMQVKLLRVLQDLEFEQVGGTKTFKIDTRVILATNEDLSRAVAEGQFPPGPVLSHQRDQHGVAAVARADLRHPLAGRALPQASARGLRQERPGFARGPGRLAAYGWPGNVRELENVIERAVLLGKGNSIGLDDLPESITAHAPLSLAAVGNRSLKEAMRPGAAVYPQVLESNHWNRQLTAETLGINRTTLYKKMKRRAWKSRARAGRVSSFLLRNDGIENLSF